MKQAAVGHACGKIILFGEHAVVHGAPAIAAGIERGVTATASSAASSELWINGLPIEEKTDEAIAYQALLDTLRVSATRTHAEVDVPSGVGLGASAAIGVAVARAALAFHDPDGRDLGTRALLAANAWERVFHQNPSGVDAACAFTGSCIRFRTAEGWQRIPLHSDLDVAICPAAPPSSTKVMIEAVARRRQENPLEFQRVLDTIVGLVESAEHCLGQGDCRELGRLMDLNHLKLVEWGLSTPALEEACSLARDAGALGAKVTGAGGGGCVIALCGNLGPSKILKRWREHGYSGFSTRIQAQ